MRRSSPPFATPSDHRPGGQDEDTIRRCWRSFSRWSSSWTRNLVTFMTLAARLDPSAELRFLNTSGRSERTRVGLRRPNWIWMRMRLGSKGSSRTWCSHAGSSCAPTPRRAARAVLVVRGDCASPRRAPATKRAGLRRTPAEVSELSSRLGAAQTENTSASDASGCAGAAGCGELITIIGVSRREGAAGTTAAGSGHAGAAQRGGAEAFTA
mmetsp:Transcript_23434/g.61735  ORF Transcript_23434/g.61735 Transcript_23434/m.61735 type:complete len:211 (+) Transcript_23434:60-692(+)